MMRFISDKYIIFIYSGWIELTGKPMVSQEFIGEANKNPTGNQQNFSAEVKKRMVQISTILAITDKEKAT